MRTERAHCRACSSELVATTISAVVLLSGCSMLVMDSSSPRPTSEPTCTESALPPLVDVMLGVVATATTLAFAGALDDMEGDRNPAPILVGGAALSVGSFASAYVGTQRASSCSASKHAWRKRPTTAAARPLRKTAPEYYDRVFLTDDAIARCR